MRILGIDPGLRTTGFGVLERHGHKLVYVASGTIKSNGNADLPSRLKTLYDGVSELVSTYRPDCASIEKVFVNVNPQSTLLLGQARGAVICGLMSGHLPVFEYTALQLKQAVKSNPAPMPPTHSAWRSATHTAARRWPPWPGWRHSLRKRACACGAAVWSADRILKACR